MKTMMKTLPMCKKGIPGDILPLFENIVQTCKGVEQLF
ncbi:hypothetical protein HNQ56_004459 [Anaerotaenia torta]